MKKYNTIINEQMGEYIMQNYKTSTVRQMSKHINIDPTYIYRFMQVRELQTLCKRKPRKSRVPEGMFDVNSREDWFIGD